MTPPSRREQERDGWGDDQHNVHPIYESHRDGGAIKMLIMEQFSEASISSDEGLPPRHPANQVFFALFPIPSIPLISIYVSSVWLVYMEMFTIFQTKWTH